MARLCQAYRNGREENRTDFTFLQSGLDGGCPDFAPCSYESDKTHRPQGVQASIPISLIILR